VQRERLVPFVVALLAVLALAAGAATLDSATTGSVSGSGDGPGVSGGDGDTVDLGAPPIEESSGEEQLIPQWLGQLLVVIVLVGGLFALLHYIWDEGLDAIKGVALTVLAFTGLLLLIYYGLKAFPTGAPTGEFGFLGRQFQIPEGGGGSSGGASEVAQVASEPSAVVFAVLAAVLVGAVAVVVRSSSDGTDDDAVERVEEDPDPSVQAVGEAAGRAADRIDESGDVDNAVFRAWREMTDPLDLPRETTTPGEFAAAAVDAGMGPDDVGELTRLFETTRYGGRTVDDEREERAVTALRRIERTYGDGR
jgi:hypothetical protein